MRVSVRFRGFSGCWLVKSFELSYSVIVFSMKMVIDTLDRGILKRRR